MKCSRLFCLTTSLLIGLAAPASADNEFKGKTIRIVIGAAAGGAYGLYGQLVSRHLGQYLPGAPNVVVTPMPGAGGLTALNYIGSANSPKDGTTISIPSPSLVQESLFNSSSRIDPQGFKWIGRIDAVTYVGVASKKSGVISVDDARAREVIAGAPGPTSSNAQIPLVLNKMAGTRFKLITGFTGTGEVFLALERGELDIAATSAATLRAVHGDAMKTGALRAVFVHAGNRLADFPSVPTISEFAKTDLEKKFMKVFSIAPEIGRSLAAPPGTSDAITEVLRIGYRSMIKDVAFLADARKIEANVEPMEGSELGRIVEEAMIAGRTDADQLKKYYDDLFGSMK